MKQYFFVGLLMVCGGCGGAALTSGPSPLETFDQDRLYVLINAAVNRGRGAECARYFQETDDQAPRNPDEVVMRAALSQVCPENMVKIAAYLDHNGVAGVKAAHIKDMAFWDRMQAQGLVDGERVRQEREQEQEERRTRRRAKAEAERQCRHQLDSRQEARLKLKSSMPLQKDFPDIKAWTGAWNEAQRQAEERDQAYSVARRACDSAGDEGAEEARRAGKPSLAALGISLPEGMRVDMVGRIN